MAILCKRTIAACLFGGMWLILLSACVCAQEVADGDGDEGLDAARQQFVRELDRLATVCDKLGLKDAAHVTRTWLPHQRSDQLTLFLPVDIADVDVSSEAAKHWLRHFMTARKKYAAALYAAVVELVKLDEPAAYRLLWNVLREDPEHAATRGILGDLASQVRAAPRIRRGTVPLRSLGWKRFSYSTVRTPHFQVFSRSKPEVTEKLAADLEKRFVLLTQIFYSSWAVKGELASHFANEKSGRVTWPSQERFRLEITDNLQEYAQLVNESMWVVAKSTGYYEPKTKRAIFHASETSLHAFEQASVTLTHEFTHQFLAEATRKQVVSDVGNNHSYWIMEGIATYMESLSDRGTYWSLGGWESPRQQTSRYRGVRDGFWLPIARLAGSSMNIWKADEELSLLYTHASGITHALMSNSLTQFSRKSTIRTIGGVYSGEDNTEALLAMFGATDEEAKQAYQDAMIVDDEDVRNLVASGHTVRELVLCGSELNDESWRLLANQADLTWLDVSFSNVGAGTLAGWLSECKSLERLSIEGTAVDGGILEQIATLRTLRELDLSDCKVDDAQLLQLKRHPRLETLWLTRTQVTDAALQTLGTMPNLKTADATGSRANTANWKRYAPR